MTPKPRRVREWRIKFVRSKSYYREAFKTENEARIFTASFISKVIVVPVELVEVKSNNRRRK